MIYRTHRERKELYIKALEEEVLRLKENFSKVTRDRDNIAEENRQLKQLLALHGIVWNGSGGADQFRRQFSPGYTSSGSISGSYAPASQSLSPQSHNGLPYSGSVSPPLTVDMNGRSLVQQQVQQGVDYDQAGIDFVLTYNDPSAAYATPPPQQRSY